MQPDDSLDVSSLSDAEARALANSASSQNKQESTMTNTETDDNIIWLNGRNAEKNESAADVQTQKSKDAEMPVDQWLALRKEEAFRINPLTAEVDWSYGQILAPYDVNPNLPRECDCIGRVYFARNPGSEVWVCFDDLPESVRSEVWKKHESKLASLLVPLD